jgi:two-component system, NtrC family, sensor kinase
MSALGQMVAGIAHEINTPLAYVKGTFDVLKEQLVPVRALAQQSHDFTAHMRRDRRDKPALTQKFLRVESSASSLLEQGLLAEMGQLLSDGVHGIEQISEIVLNLKNFSRVDRAKITEYSVQAGLQSTLLLARNLLKNRVEVREEYAAVPNIECSPSQINQVFLNIITNAVHAIPTDRKGLITLRTSLEDDSAVRVEIQDNGTGIDAQTLSKIFDPFFTTKPIGQGTGLGLSISYKIVQDHGGRILVDSEVGVGTVFSVLLPLRATATQPGPIEEEALFAA